MILLQSLLFCAGIAALYFGAEWLVKGASRFAYFLNIKPIIIGLTIIAFGTSAPELVTGIISGIRNLNDIAIGNVIGSNIARWTGTWGNRNNPSTESGNEPPPQGNPNYYRHFRPFVSDVQKRHS